MGLVGPPALLPFSPSEGGLLLPLKQRGQQPFQGLANFAAAVGHLRPFRIIGGVRNFFRRPVGGSVGRANLSGALGLYKVAKGGTAAFRRVLPKGPSSGLRGWVFGGVFGGIFGRVLSGIFGEIGAKGLSGAGVSLFRRFFGVFTCRIFTAALIDNFSAVSGVRAPAASAAFAVVPPFAVPVAAI